MTLPFETFAAAVARRGVDPGALEAHAADLYLAIACGELDPAALERFERLYIARVGDYVARLGLPADAVDDVRQAVRIRMLTGAEPRIRSYAGRGSLEAWVRILSLRTALNRLEARRPDETRRETDGLEALVDGESGSELRLIRERYRERFQAALEASLLSLSAREKTVLRMSFLDGQSIDVIGRVFRVHRATVARWLVAIRKRLLDDVRRALSLKLGATASEAQSLIELIGADVRVSVARLLGEKPPER